MGLAAELAFLLFSSASLSITYYTGAGGLAWLNLNFFQLTKILPSKTLVKVQSGGPSLLSLYHQP